MNHLKLKICNRALTTRTMHRALSSVANGLNEFQSLAGHMKLSELTILSETIAVLKTTIKELEAVARNCSTELKDQLDAAIAPRRAHLKELEADQIKLQKEYLQSWHDLINNTKRGL